MDLFEKKNIDHDLSKLRREAEEREAQRQAEKTGLSYINLGSASVNLDVLKVIGEDEAREAKAATIDSKRKTLALAVYDADKPETKKLIDKLERKGFEINILISSLSGLKKVWERYQEIKLTPEKGALTGIELENIEALKRLKFDSLPLKIKELESKKSVSTTEILDLVLGSAITLHVSDIHFETEKNAVLLRFRMDGLLYDVSRLENTVYLPLLNRLKLISGLKINITNIPQDGRFTIKFGNDYIEIRSSIIPAEYGETVVMRVLDPHTIALTLSDLGLRSEDEKIINTELKKPNGTILVTGPTGSGKTTTLYAFLKAVHSSELKVITIEDPIEYHLDGIEQTQVDPKSGYTFVSGLRSILRQDPDILLVGEIRDLETAQIGMQAALTGHLVFSTLHTNDAAGAIPRLVDLGVKPSIIGPALNLIIAQRLVRKLCEDCKTQISIDPETEKKIEIFLSELPSEVSKPYIGKDIRLYEIKGCGKCRHGFDGRVGIFELLACGDDLESLIAKDATEEAIKKLAKKQGMVEMQADGILKVLDGITTFREVERTTGPINWLD